MTLRPIKLGLSALVAATWTDVVKRPFGALLSPNGILPRYFALWIDIVKR